MEHSIAYLIGGAFAVGCWGALFGWISLRNKKNPLRAKVIAVVNAILFPLVIPLSRANTYSWLEIAVLAIIGSLFAWAIVQRIEIKSKI